MHRNETLALSDLERTTLAVARDILATRMREGASTPPEIVGVLATLEMTLRNACDHNPETHRLRDLPHGRAWEITCPECRASWTQWDPAHD